MSSNIDEIGNIQWELVVYLLVAWIITFFCLFKVPFVRQQCSDVYDAGRENLRQSSVLYSHSTVHYPSCAIGTSYYVAR